MAQLSVALNSNWLEWLEWLKFEVLFLSQNDFKVDFCFVELCAVLTLRIFGSCDLGENMGNNLEITLEPSRKLQTSDFVACMGHAS